MEGVRSAAHPPPTPHPHSITPATITKTPPLTPSRGWLGAGRGFEPCCGMKVVTPFPCPTDKQVTPPPTGRVCQTFRLPTGPGRPGKTTVLEVG